jgi:hypothetical protein
VSVAALSKSSIPFRRSMVMNKQARTKNGIPTRALGAATLFAALAVAPLAGCGQDFDPPSLIAKTRVLGAIVQVDGDETRATPQPGEGATVTWIVAAPGDLPALGWAFLICAAGASPNPAACAAAPLAIAQGTGTPQFHLAVPAADTLGDARRLTVVGQICDGGAPALDPQTGMPACPGEGTAVTVDIPVQRTADGANHNPNLAARSLWIDGVEWPAGDALDCASLPSVAAGSKDHVIRLATLAEDRETIVTPADNPTAPTAPTAPAPPPTTTREQLQLSCFDTDGELGQTFAFVPAADDSPESDVEIKWDAPDAPPTGGRVHFTFVARDLRGGVGTTTRTACVQ